ncbi:TRAP transporter small permease subunit [Pontibacillus yanchengensis]|uniref:TRAP transporter small permease subunit n=1 Tax=Pontibacillus yanchengensis TaxID=462910 RepID=A0ACC7VIT1_9BACI|nr:TRAP transporter small permease [Pontibacillus yanchengensis]MYL54866.1 TRAP transporter small permease subunit [Pontibacillus yanchengensis]
MKTVLYILKKMEEISVGIAMSIAVLLSFVEVVLRKFFGESLGFTHEVVVYLLIYAGLVGAAIGVRDKVHLGVDLAVKQFPHTLQKGVVLVTTAVCTFFTTVITVLGVQHVGNIAAFGQVTPELEIPLFIPLLIVPLSFGLMTLHFIRELLQVIRTKPEHVLQEEGGAH